MYYFCIFIFVLYNVEKILMEMEIQFLKRINFDLKFLELMVIFVF